jgi:hypothetical protein
MPQADQPHRRSRTCTLEKMSTPSSPKEKSATATSSTHPREVCRPSKDNALGREPGMTQTSQAIAFLF